MRFPPLSFAVLDTETTGFLPRVHHIAEWACVRYEQGRQSASYESLIAIPDELPEHVQVLTRIRPDMLTGQPTIAEARETFLETLGTDTLLVGQNLGYDLGMLKGEGIDLTDRPWIDTSLLAGLVFPELRSYSLQYLSNALNLPHEPQHRALGDVHATAALLGAIWERLCDLPPKHLHDAKKIMSRVSEGYRQFFAALPDTGGSGSWLELARHRHETTTSAPVALPPSTPGRVALLEEPLDPTFVPSLIAAAATDTTPTWFAVKNLDTALRRHDVPEGVAILYPPSVLLDPDAAARLLAQESFTPDEATLALKLSWFSPRIRSDLSLHAGERDVWSGKLAATADHPIYINQCRSDAYVHLLDHRQLLTFLRSPDIEDRLIPVGARVIIDDASMLEDTATKTFGAQLSLDDLRAASQGHDDLTRLADRVALWAETVKAGTDMHMLTAADLSRPETKGITQLLDDMLATNLAPRVRYLLSELKTFLHPALGIPMLTWIETRAQSGSVTLHSAPERIDALLQRILFDPFATILLVPPALQGAMPCVLPEKLPRQIHSSDRPLETYALSFPDTALNDVLLDPPAGKTIALVGSKRLIEQAFIEHTERLEACNVTLICQGMSGGQGRMESDFLASKGTTIWLLTPWMYEGIDLPEACVDHLILDSVPFDHPGQPVFSKRKDVFRNGFEQYALVRVLHRLFRLVRAFARHAIRHADVRILDQRMKQKSYGERVRSYLQTFAVSPSAFVSTRTDPPKKTPTKPLRKKKDDGPQQALPL